VDREGAAVVAACARILGYRAEAEDVAQEAFVIAYRSLSTWRAEGAFGAWLSRIAVRLAIRRARARRQVTWLDPIAAEADPAGSERYRSMGATVAVDPATRVLRAERDTQLRTAVASLDEPYREVVALRFFAERSLQEIADATDRPLGTVKTHLHRGLARLRRAIEEPDR
jgi:RNA polymerase sigma-70 factor (ECF subfamily)